MSTMTNHDFPTRTRRSHDAVAAAYGVTFKDELSGKPLERAVLTYFAALVPRGRVLDVRAGSGRVTSHLAALGLDISGVELSPSLVALARDEHPELRFEVATLSRLPVPDRSLAGLVAFSGLAVPDDELPAVLASFRRALAPGGVALFAFEVGTHGPRPDQMADRLDAAGLHVSACMLRDAEAGEHAPHAFFIARKTDH